MAESKKRVVKAAEKEAKRNERLIRARVLRDSGYSNAEIAKALGVKEAVVRNMFKEECKDD